MDHRLWLQTISSPGIFADYYPRFCRSLPLFGPYWLGRYQWANTNIWDYVYFSGITFLTVGYGDIIPSSIPAKVIALLVGFVGLGSYSLFIAMMARKMFKF
ncbi:MAG: two pore domain potassium channel family protein [Firmicutes bacterium]|nr:two pore domain potassium channel family protein [Bacillota bacterium]